MGRESRETRSAGDADARARLPRSDEILEVCRDDGTILCVPARRRALRVLIVDDYRDAADSLAILVNLWGHDGRVAYGGEAALEMAWAYQPDVLLLDLAMPRMDGYQVARQLRRESRFKATLLVATTGYADGAHYLLGMKAGFDRYLGKPIEPTIVEDLLLREQQRLTVSPAAIVAPAKCGTPAFADETRRVLSAGLR
jgi:CheY-like chemotaxis protein